MPSTIMNIKLRASDYIYTYVLLYKFIHISLYVYARIFIASSFCNFAVYALSKNNIKSFLFKNKYNTPSDEINTSDLQNTEK